MLNHKTDMDHYYINRTAGPVAVHKEGCAALQDLPQRIYIGLFASALRALKQAGKINPAAAPCRHCTGKKKMAINKKIQYA